MNPIFVKEELMRQRAQFNDNKPSVYGGGVDCAVDSLTRHVMPICKEFSTTRMHEPTHTYYKTEEYGERVLHGSCTGFIGASFQSNTPEEMAKNMGATSRARNSALYGQGQVAILNGWKLNGDRAGSLGSIVHLELELYLNSARHTDEESLVWADSLLNAKDLRRETMSRATGRLAGVCPSSIEDGSAFELELEYVPEKHLQLFHFDQDTAEVDDAQMAWLKDLKQRSTELADRAAFLLDTPDAYARWFIGSALGQARQFFKDHIDGRLPVVGTEWTVVWERFDFAGQFDALFEGVLVDWKTSSHSLALGYNSFYRTGTGVLSGVNDSDLDRYCLQTTAYALCVSEQTDIKIHEIWVVSFNSRFPTYQMVKIKPRNRLMRAMLKDRRQQALTRYSTNSLTTVHNLSEFLDSIAPAFGDNPVIAVAVEKMEELVDSVRSLTALLQHRSPKYDSDTESCKKRKNADPV